MLRTSSYLIDVERAECAVPADKVREMDLVRKGEGVETVNKRVAGAVLGGWRRRSSKTSRSTRPCAASPSAARALPRDRVEDALDAAAAGGRPVAVEALVARGVVDLASNVTTRCGPRRRRRHREVVAALIAAGAASTGASQPRGHAAVHGGGQRPPRGRWRR